MVDLVEKDVIPNQASPIRPWFIHNLSESVDLRDEGDLNLTDRWLRWAKQHRWQCFGGLALLYVIGFNGQWRLGSDSALYMNVGRSLAEGMGYTYGGSVSRVIYPSLPWLLAGLSTVGGHENYFLPTLFMLVLGFVALALVYRLISLHSDRATAVCVTCLTGISYTFYQYAFEILSDMLFCVAVMSVLAGYEGLWQRARAQYHNRLACLLDGSLLAGGLMIAVATRPTMWVLAMALLGTSVWYLLVGKQRLIHCGIVAFMVVCVVGFWFIDPRQAAGGQGATKLPNYERWAISQLHKLDSLWHTVFTEHLPKFFEPHLAEAIFGMELGPGLNTIAGITILALGIHLGRVRLLWGAWFVLMIVAMLIAKPVVRYTLPLIPLVAFAWWRVIVLLTKKLPQPRSNQVAILLIGLWCVPNLVRVSNFILHQRHIPFMESYKKGRYTPLLDLATQFKEKIDLDAVIIAEYSHELSYFSRRPVKHTTAVLSRDNQPTGKLGKWLELNRTVYLVAVDDEAAQQFASALHARVGQKVLLASGLRSPAALYRILGDP